MLLDGRYSGMPFVAINGNFGLPNVCEVILDQQTAVEEAVRYCYNQGRRHIGMVYKNSRVLMCANIRVFWTAYANAT